MAHFQLAFTSLNQYNPDPGFPESIELPTFIVKRKLIPVTVPDYTREYL
jgi:hypothetical protein